MKVFVSMETVRKNGGIICNGVGERNGKQSVELRSVNNEKATDRRVGKRERKDPSRTMKSAVHADAVDPKKELIEQSFKRHKHVEVGALPFEEVFT
jgi:uncharacterized Zn finger protein (UPF0148 family)